MASCRIRVGKIVMDPLYIDIVPRRWYAVFDFLVGTYSSLSHFCHNKFNLVQLINCVQKNPTDRKECLGDSFSFK